MKKVINMNEKEARNFFLKPESYFNLEMPEYFNFGNIINDTLKKIGTEKDFKKFKCGNPRDYETINYKMICNKDGKYGWRPFEIIHPLKYIELVNLITQRDFWTFIKNRFKSFSKNKKIQCCSIPVESPSKKYDKKSSILTWWSQFEQKSISYSLKYNYMATADITNCYPSIYTHSIAWALHTREYCKQHRTDPIVGNLIDNIMQDLSYGQTNGIPQGSALTDFIAEMVLGYADELLSERLKNIDNYEILRYRDDYRIFSNEKSVVELIMKELTDVLSSLNLKINNSKTNVFSDVITGSIKDDKLFCIENRIKEDNLENTLLAIRSIGIKYPNSGSLYKLLVSLYKNKISKSKSRINSLDQNVSIIVDIMYNNPRTYNVCVAILGKILEPLKPKNRMKIIDDIIKKFDNVPNIDYLNIWLQRLTIIDNRKLEYRTPLCKKIYSDNYIWESGWLNFDLDEKSIIDEDVINNISYSIPNEVVDKFNSNYN